MLPVYRCADSYPQQRNQMPFTQYYHPGSDAVPPQMRMDPAKSPISYESWPYGGNYGYPTPFHACCNHSYFPAYHTCPPPHPHLSPSLPFHCHGSYPVFPEAYPVQYVPPPHSLMDQQPRYEFDKSVAGNYHCCGCPNHMGNQREDRSLKIEEQEADAENKGSNSLAPIELKNYPYPTVWIPPGYLKNKDDRKALESEVKDGDEIPHDTKAPENTKSLDPRVLNGWFPLDMNTIGSLKQGGDGKRTQSWQDGDKIGQFPLPIIWMPSHDKPEELEKMGHKDSNAAPKSTEELPSNFKVIPLKLPDSDDSAKKLKENEENSSDEFGVKMMEKNANRKSIPVKQKELHGEMKMASEDSQGKTRGIPVKHVEDNNVLKNPSESSAKRQSSSPPTKVSKLPPVCLRVDPLPRRKNGNGSSRSPSPSGHNRNSQVISNEKSKASASTNLKENTQQDSRALNCAASKSKEVEQYKERKVIEVTEITDGQNKDKDLKNGSQTDIQSQMQVPVNLPIGNHDASKCNGEEGEGVKAVEDMAFEEGKKGADKAQAGEGECKIAEDKRVSEAKMEQSEDVVEKRNLLDAEAAVIIQSAYRGFQVRKWEPLKKLKQIAKVREQVVEVRSQIHALESSSDLRRDEKQRVIIGETIMNLLLKLDTIQGLHPSIREIRKSVARELTNLQEKLDSLTTQNSEELSQDVPSAKLAEGCVDTLGDVCKQVGQDNEAKEAGYGDNSSESGCETSSALKEPHQCQLPHVSDAVSGSQGEETSERLEDGVDGECKNKGTEVASDEDPKVAEPELITEPKDELDDEKLDGSKGVMMEIQNANFEPHSDSEHKHSVELPLVVNEDTAVPENDKDGMIKSHKDETLVGGEDEQIETRKIEALHDGEVELNVGIDVVSPYDKTPDMNQQEEQHPEEVLEEGPLAAKLEDYVKADAQNASELKQEAVQPQEEDISHDNELVEVSEAEEAQPVFTSVEKENHDEEQEEAMQPQLGDGISHDNELEEAQPVFALMEKEIHDEEQEEVKGIIIVEETKGENVNQPEAIGEKGEAMKEKVESKKLEFETAKDEALAGTQYAPTGAEQGEDKEELFHVSPTFAARENVTESDKKLIEENEKLREMMEKLIEAGKEQLTVISNLSGRVKDLERKLSARKNKKLRTRRYRAATSASSCTQPSNASIKQRTACYAM